MKSRLPFLFLFSLLNSNLETTAVAKESSSLTLYHNQQKNAPVDLKSQTLPGNSGFIMLGAAPETNAVTSPAIVSTKELTSIPGFSGSATAPSTITKYVLRSLPDPNTQGTLYLYNAGWKLNLNEEIAISHLNYLFFDPVDNATGSVTISVAAIDNSGAEDASPATYTIPIITNTRPLGDERTTGKGNIIVVPHTAVNFQMPGLTATDPDAGSSITGYKISWLPSSSHGTLYINNAPAVVSTWNAPRIYSPAEVSQLVWNPNPGYKSFTNFAFLAIDNHDAEGVAVNYVIYNETDKPAVYSSGNTYSRFLLSNGKVVATVTDPDGAITKAALSGPALPDFLVLNANGSISANGSTAVAGVYSTTVTLTDAKNGISTSVPVTIIINSEQYIVNSAAVKTADDCFTLTPNADNKQGQVWRSVPVSLENSFEVDFDVYLGNKDINAGQGIVFGLQRSGSDPATAKGAGEGAFGFGGLQPSVGIEFDTDQNTVSANEPAFDHIAIFKNGTETSPVIAPVQMSATAANTEDNATHKVKIIWKKSSNTLFVYFDNVLRTSYSEDFINTVFGGNPSVYFGFTASTNWFMNQQSVCGIYFNQLDQDSDGIADAADADDDNDGIPDLLETENQDPSADDDNDGLPNFRDLTYFAYADANGNGRNDHDENNDGINDFFDKDSDSVINAFDLDADNDGITDVIEQAAKGFEPAGIYDALSGRLNGSVSASGTPANATTLTAASLSDFDNDGLKNYLDLDADNDGIADNLEAQTLALAQKKGLDADKDGIDDSFDASCGCAMAGEALIPVNTDSDQWPDYLDRDADNDDMTDDVEALDSNRNGVSLDDVYTMANSYRNNAGLTTSLAPNNLYETPSDKSRIANWLKDDNSNGVLNYLDPVSVYYQDKNVNGLVDLFDAQSFGAEPTLNEAYRDASKNTPLPVELVSFTATADKVSIRLNWATATEVNNHYFQVQRSADGEAFTTIGIVKGAGTVSQAQAYRFTDAKPLTGLNYYRLKQVDLNGTFTYSTITTATTGKQAALGLHVFPNPVKSSVSVEVTLPAPDAVVLEIRNTLGVLLQTTSLQPLAGKQTLELNVNYLPKGLYVIIARGKNTYQVKQLIKE